MSTPPARLLIRQLRALQALMARHQQEQMCLTIRSDALNPSTGAKAALASSAAPAADADARPRRNASKTTRSRPPSSSPLLPDPSSSGSAASAASPKRPPPQKLAAGRSSPPPSPHHHPHLLPAGDLLARIRAARSLGELELLLARYAPSFRPPHVAAALIALPPLMTPGGSASTAESNRRARAHRLARLLAARGLARGGAASRLGGSDAAECLRAMARLRCAPSEAVQALAARLVEREGAAVALLQPRELAAAAWALAVIERRQGEGWWVEEAEESNKAAAGEAVGSLEAGATLGASLPPAAVTPTAAALAAPPSDEQKDDGADDDGDEQANALLTSALIASLPVPEPPPVPPRGRGAAPLPPVLPPLPASTARLPVAASSSSTAAAAALVRASPQPPALQALWQHLEARSRALVHNFAPTHAAALVWAFAVTGRCSNHRSSRGGGGGGVTVAAARDDDDDEDDDDEDDDDEDDEAGEPGKRDGRHHHHHHQAVNLLTALSRSLLMRQHTLTDPTAVARLLEAIALAASSSPPSSSSSSGSADRPAPSPRLPRAQRELALALGDRVAQLKASFYPPAQLVGCLASLARAGLYHPRAAGAVGAMVSSRLGPAAAPAAASSSFAPPPGSADPAASASSPPSLLQSSLTCLRGGWVPSAIPSYLSAARRLAHSDPPALLACARALPAAAPHLPAEALAASLESLVDLGLGRARGVEVVVMARGSASGGGGGGGGEDDPAEAKHERQALALAASAVRAEVDRAGPDELSAGAAARLLWAYAMVWGDELMRMTEEEGREGGGGGGGDGAPSSPLDVPLEALRRRGGEGVSALLSPLETHRLYQAHRLLTEAWAFEKDQEEAKEDDGNGGGGGRWPAQLVRGAAQATRRRFANRRDPSTFSSSSSSPRLQHLCDLLSEAGIDPIVGGGGGADAGGIPVDVAVLLEEEDGGGKGDGRDKASSEPSAPRLIALMLDEDEKGFSSSSSSSSSSPSSSWRRRRAANPPHAQLGAAEADARVLTERLGWSAVVRVPWFEWEAVLAAERELFGGGGGGGRGSSPSGVRLRGGGSAAAALRRAREERAEMGAVLGVEDLSEPDDGALLAWVHNKLLSAV